MDLDIRENGTICTIKLKGRLVSGDPVSQFEKAFQSALNTGHIYLIFDLETLSFIDSAAIGSIVNALKISTKFGGTVKLVKPSSFVSKTLKMVGILALFSVYETEEEAVASYGSV